MWEAPRSIGVPTLRVTTLTGTTVCPLAARTVVPPGSATMPWVGPVPGRTIGVPATWRTRSTGITTSCWEAPAGVVEEEGAPPVVTGLELPVELEVGAPSVVTT